MERSNLFVLSIVAVVAVVGLLTVFLQGGVGTPGGKILAAEKGNIEGQAIRGSPATSVARAPPRSPSLVAGGACPSCSLVWVDPGELVSKFGAEIRTDGRAPDYVCTELEYGGCFAGLTSTTMIISCSALRASLP